MKNLIKCLTLMALSAKFFGNTDTQEVTISTTDVQTIDVPATVTITATYSTLTSSWSGTSTSQTANYASSQNFNVTAEANTPSVLWSANDVLKINQGVVERTLISNGNATIQTILSNGTAGSGTFNYTYTFSSTDGITEPDRTATITFTISNAS